jgi:hypothetical protein
LTTLIAIGFGRAGERKAKVPRVDAVVAGHLQHQISRRSVHPVEQDNVRAGLDILEGFAPACVDLDRTNRL